MARRTRGVDRAEPPAGVFAEKSKGCELGGRPVPRDAGPLTLRQEV